MNKVVIGLAVVVLAFVLFQKHQQDSRVGAYKEKQALLAVSCFEVTRESSRAAPSKNGYSYRYNDLYLSVRAKNVSGRHLRGVVLETHIEDARHSLNGALSIHIGDMSPGQSYTTDEFIKKLTEDQFFRTKKKCRVKHAEVVDAI